MLNSVTNVDPAISRSSILVDKERGRGRTAFCICRIYMLLDGCDSIDTIIDIIDYRYVQLILSCELVEMLNNATLKASTVYYILVLNTSSVAPPEVSMQNQDGTKMAAL